MQRGLAKKASLPDVEDMNVALNLFYYPLHPKSIPSHNSPSQNEWLRSQLAKAKFLAWKTNLGHQEVLMKWYP